jgi:hypothetical protein
MAMVRQVSRSIGTSSPCVAVLGITQAEAAALSYHGKLPLVPLAEAQSCGWLLMHPQAQSAFVKTPLASQWVVYSGARRRTSVNNDLLVFKRASAGAAPLTK